MSFGNTVIHVPNICLSCLQSFIHHRLVSLPSTMHTHVTVTTSPVIHTSEFGRHTFDHAYTHHGRHARLRSFIHHNSAGMTFLDIHTPLFGCYVSGHPRISLGCHAIDRARHTWSSCIMSPVIRGPHPLVVTHHRSCTPHFLVVYHVSGHPSPSLARS